MVLELLLDGIDGKFMPNEGLTPSFHGPRNTLRQLFMAISCLTKVLHHGFMAHEMFCDMSSWKIGSFMGQEMRFMGSSLDIHDIFIKLFLSEFFSDILSAKLHYSLENDYKASS